MKVAITDFNFPHVEREGEILSRAGAEWAAYQCKTPVEVIENCREADALIVQWATIDRTVIAALERCKVIVRYGIGVDNVDLEAAADRGIPVCNVPDYCIDEVADHTMALALALARQLSQTDAAVRAGVWKILPPAPAFSFREMVFATAGFGRIARAVLRRAVGFGFQVAAYDPWVDPSVFASLGVRRLTLGELLAGADILSLHLPLKHETRHLVGSLSLPAMKNTALVVNTARGGLIDTRALAGALTDGRIAGAGLDVFEEEPLPADHPLRRAPNVILTSHTAWYSEASVPQLQQKAAEEAVRALQGQPLQNVVNGVTAARLP
jgi:D-3-phosphoglycerate dehydrogenase